jgi:hypothetical protein
MLLIIRRAWVTAGVLLGGPKIRNQLPASCEADDGHYYCAGDRLEEAERHQLGCVLTAS